ncbi:hypothetical protein BDZ89DRAFT_1065077 [Hymenopellis radicata]|nr:hypothetical protein BDZ89DRAFT_1065077 [Hymenopellis radicata]
MAPLIPRVNQHDMGSRSGVLLNVWIYFNLVSNTILLPLLVVVLLVSKRAKRHPTVINVCMTWILSGIFSLLLFYAGEYKPDTPEPTKSLCIAQTALLYGITPMWSVAILALVYHMVVISTGSEVSKPRMIGMLVAPYTVQLIFTISNLAISVSHPNLVNRHRRFFYCALKCDALANTMILFTFVMCIAIIALQIYLAIILRRNWTGMRKAGIPGGVDIQLLSRVLVFGVCILFGIVVNLIVLFDEHNLAPDMYAATIGTVIFLVFGSQPGVLRTVMFWKNDESQSRPATIYLPRERSWGVSVDLVASPRDGSTFGDLMVRQPEH